MGNIKRTVFILWSILTFSVIMGSSVLKNRVQVLERRLNTINSEIQKDIAEIHVLKAQWSMENTPDRLRKLAYEQLSLENARPEQIINYSALQFNNETAGSVKPTGSKKQFTTLVKAEVKKNAQ